MIGIGIADTCASARVLILGTDLSLISVMKWRSMEA